MRNFLETVMNSEPLVTGKNIDLTQFVCRFLRDRGAVLETAGEMINILLPKDLSQALDVEELISVAKDTDAVSTFGGHKLYSIALQSILLERITSLAASTFPVLQTELKFHYIKSQGFDTLIKEQFGFHGIKIKIKGTAETMTRYVLLTCRFLAQSDEQKQGLLDFSFNLDTGASVPEMSRMMPYAEKQYQTKNAQAFTKKDIRHIHEWVSFHGPGAVEPDLLDFVRSMNRRLKRDALSLEAYYRALEEEMRESLSRTGISDKLIRERQEKIDLIPEELAVKKKDLLKKYSIRIGFFPVAAMRVTTPCITVFVTLMSGRQKTDISLHYNPVTKKMDPMVCPSCGKSMYSLGLCRHLHPNCNTCLEVGCNCC